MERLSSMLVLAIVLCVAGGFAMSFQPALNAELARGAGSAIWAALISVAMSTLVMTLVVLVFQLPAPGRGLLTIPPWGWLGGATGVAFICASLWSVGQLGLTGVIVLAVAGQFLGAALADHFGLFNLPKRSFDLTRLGGLLLIASGVTLILRRL